MQSLVNLGWRGVAGEPCSLDCPDTLGLIKTYRGREIILCARHARVLENGKHGNTYSGAPLPAESRATEWPWMPVRVIDPVLIA